MTSGTIPGATYRLQFNRAFTFDDAARIVPYLAKLGISHIYASPYFRARANSTHGYDVVDHNALNPEIGDEESFTRLVAELQRHGMGQILDVVPNHMGVHGDDNAWWLDVLENGPASRYAAYFDIDWQPVRDVLRGKVLLPLLGDHYGALLESGEVTLEFAAATGQFSARYYQHRFPLDPRTYPVILEHAAAVPEAPDTDPKAVVELQYVAEALARLPSRTCPHDDIARRYRDQTALKERLILLYRNSPDITARIDAAVREFNGTPGEPPTFDRLHGLLDRQAWRLAYWRVASDEINYRRFFDINDLAGLRVENPAVLDAVHRRAFELIDRRDIDGLRIDHIDGIYDPAQYLQRLARRIDDTAGTTSGDARTEQAVPCRYLLVEKILAGYEHLPDDWPVHGTTGYDFCAAVNELLVYPDSGKALERLYRRFTQTTFNLTDLLYQQKKLVIRVQLSSELTVLTNELDHIAQRNRHTRDYTLNGLRDALMEVVACFPVYRTYIAGGRVTDADRQFVEWAITQAKRRSPAADISIFSFIRELMLPAEPYGTDDPQERQRLGFVMRFQQYTGPVMAKAYEDTVFYIYNRLVSLNEVGGDPSRFGITLAAFHRFMQAQANHWPHAMLTTSTHDTKRSEDVRARINVLSELPDEWRKRVARWSRLNRSRTRLVDARRTPSRNDEYLFYQTLIGVWPLETVEPSAESALRERIENYMLKAIREAKMYTSWINPDTDYETGVIEFVRQTLRTDGRNAFLADFLAFHQRIVRCGLLNALAQTLIKFVAPGVPDIYRGNEVWTFDLVDPDNRRPVDYRQCESLLDDLLKGDTGATPEIAEDLWHHLEDGRAKLYMTSRALRLRRRHGDLFRSGSYIPLPAAGPRADHVCAFARRLEQLEVVCAVPRWFARLGAFDGTFPADTWTDTGIALPSMPDNQVYHNVFTGTPIAAVTHDGQPVLDCRSLFADFPVALLVNATLSAT